MALTIACTGLKGGIGKSTVALNIATCLHRAGHRTLLVDADSQATLRAWASKGAELGYDGPPVVAIDGKTMRRDLERVAEGFACVVVDSPPRLGTEARASMVAADLVLLPVVPGAADVWALQETLAVLEEARGLRPDLKAAIVLNRLDRTGLATAVRTAVADVGVPVMETTLGARVAYGEATLSGQGVVDYAPRSVAAREVERLTREALDIIGGTTSGKEGGTVRKRSKATRATKASAHT